MINQKDTNITKPDDANPQTQFKASNKNTPKGSPNVNKKINFNSAEQLTQFNKDENPNPSEKLSKNSNLKSSADF